MTSDESDKRSIQIVLLALLGNVSIAISKLFGAWFTYSSSMFAEGIHSLVDTANQIFLLLGFKLSIRPPDKYHPFGYGKERYFWAFVVAISMFTIGSILSIQKGINKLLHPVPLQNVAMNYIILGFSFIIEAITCFLAYKNLKKNSTESIMEIIRESKSISIIIVFLEDSAALIGLMLAFLGISFSSQFNTPLFDAAASILIGVFLAIVAIIISLETKSLLIGEGVSSRDYKKIKSAISTIPGVEKVLEILSMYFGPNELLIAINVNFTNELSTDEIETVIDNIERRIRQIKPEAKRIFIEAESLDTIEVLQSIAQKRTTRKTKQKKQTV